MKQLRGQALHTQPFRSDSGWTHAKRKKGHGRRLSVGSEDAWIKYNNILREHDLLMVSSWKDGIDTLLVFAGLFSAVLTAFIVESYTFLQPDLQSVSINLLREILTELRNMSSPQSARNINSQFPHISPAPPAFAVRINTMWFCSLIFSLSAASMCILVKQWLWDHSSHTGTSPRESARIRQFRLRGLKRWHVQEIVTALPGLLQWALALFFAGLVDLLWSLNFIVAGIVTVFACASLLFLVVTTVLPTFCVDSPYRSPQALEFFFIYRAIVRFMAWAITKTICPSGLDQHSWPSCTSHHPIRGRLDKCKLWLLSTLCERRPSNWREREREIVRTQEASRLDCQILAGADALFVDDDVLEDVIRPCLGDMDPLAAADCLVDILSRRADGMVNGLPSWKPSETVEPSVAAQLRLTLAVLSRLHSSADEERVLKIIDILHRICASVPLEPNNPDSEYFYEQVVDVVSKLLSANDNIIRRSVFNLLLKLRSRQLLHV